MADKVRPIKPSEVAAEKAKVFPDAVFESFNEIIAQASTGGSVTIKQADVVELMVKKGLKEEEIQRSGWLNIEEAYRAAGWKVEYDKPAYNESYPATFTFSPRRKTD